MTRSNAAIIFGGRSREHDVSLQSAGSVIKNITTDKYNVSLIGITRKGQWRLYHGTADNIMHWEDHSEPIVLPPDPCCRGYFSIDNPREVHRIDVAFPVMHGTYAEDGTIQSVLELAGIPYVGSGVLSSAVTMDKVTAKQICGYCKIPQCRFRFCEITDWQDDQMRIISEFEELSYPIFIKPANMGSSVGISKAKNRNELINAIDNAFRFDRKVIAEEFIDGIEVECAVMGNEYPFASTPGEVTPAKEFYDYEAKYSDNYDSRVYIPARLDNKKLDEVKLLALKVYKTLNCRGLSRVDFFVKKKDKAVLLNEVNSLPGFTKISMYPQMMMHDGMKFSEITDKLFELAIEEHNKKNRIEY